MVVGQIGFHKDKDVKKVIYHHFGKFIFKILDSLRKENHRNCETTRKDTR